MKRRIANVWNFLLWIVIFISIASVFLFAITLFTNIQKPTTDVSAPSIQANQPSSSLTEQVNGIPPSLLKKKNEPHQPISITFTGDILLDKSVGTSIEQHGVDYPFTKVSSILQQADITVGNLETSVSTRGTPQDKQYTFRSKPQYLQGLVNSGYDMVSLANNHTLDFGVEAMQDTIEHLNKYEIGHSGAGNNEEEAFQAYYTEVHGKRIAILGISRVLPEASWFAKDDTPGLAHAYQMEPMMSYVKEAVKDSDYTIIMIHWNKERMDYPEPYANEMAKAFIDAGVDSVIGGHSHSLMGIEFYKNAPIYYSLGNFVFTNSKSPKSHETMLVTVTYDNEKITTKLVPAKLVNGQVQLMDEGYNKTIIQKLNHLSFNASIDALGNVSPK